jgi:hypothetical protein
MLTIACMWTIYRRPGPLAGIGLHVAFRLQQSKSVLMQVMPLNLLCQQGPRQKAGAHILDLVAPPNAAAAGDDAAKSLPNDVAAIAPSTEGNAPTAKAAVTKGGGGSGGDARQIAASGLADSTPDIDTAAADAGRLWICG